MATLRLVYLSEYSDSFIGNPGSPPKVDLKQTPRLFFRGALHLRDQTMSGEVVNKVDATVLVRGSLKSTPDLFGVDYVQR